MADELYMREALRCLEWWACWCVLLVVPVVVLTLQLWNVDIRLMIRGWLWAEWMRWNIMFALVQHFRLPPHPPPSLSSNIVSGVWRISWRKRSILTVLQGFRRLTTVLMNEHTRRAKSPYEESRVLFCRRWGKVKYKCSQSVLILPCSRRTSTRIALFMWTTLHLPRFIIPTVRSRRSQALSQHYEDSMTVLSPESSFRRALQMIFNFPSMIYKHALFQGWLVSTYWRLPVFYLLSSRCSYRWPPRLTFWSSIINTFASIVSAHLSCLHVVISIRYVDS